MASDLSGSDPQDSSGRTIFQTLEVEALKLCDMERSQAFAIDDMCIGREYEDHVFTNLTNIFFNRIYNDKDDSLRKIFGPDKEIHVQNLAEYLQQRTGGKPLYTNRVGINTLHYRHAQLPLSIELANQWVDHMEDALDDVRREIKTKHRQALLDFMRFTAYYFVVCSEYHREISNKRLLF